MRLFIREHLALTCWVVAILFTVVAVFWYDGYNDWVTAAYAVALGLFLYIGYLVYRYYSHRSFYTRMSRSMDSLKEFVPLNETSPLSLALEKLLDSQYGQYHAHLHRLEQRQQEYLTFMNQWVHQMKTPLSVIELTVEGQEDDDPRLVSIREEADQMRRGLETVLYVARLDTFEQDFSVEPVILRTAGEEAIHEPETVLHPQSRLSRDTYRSCTGCAIRCQVDSFCLSTVTVQCNQIFRGQRAKDLCACV